MSFLDAKPYPQSQQQETNTLEAINKYTQTAIEVSIKELAEEIELFDEKPIDEEQTERESKIEPFEREVAEIESKVEKIKRIADFSRKFQELQQEIQDDRDLIDALYISIFSVAD
jgi:predicted RNase H-like nuclease (RuvC/YqgF family)